MICINDMHTGFHINKGWIVNIDARALHYDATLYDNPTMFDPSRFKVIKLINYRWFNPYHIQLYMR